VGVLVGCGRVAATPLPQCLWFFLTLKLYFVCRVELYVFEVASISYVYELSIATWVRISQLMIYCVIGKNSME
jgi:predicted membrane chloride channel (bestrophin family)